MTRAQALFGAGAVVEAEFIAARVTVYRPATFSGMSEVPLVILGRFGPFPSGEEAEAYALFLKGCAHPPAPTDGSWAREFHAVLAKDIA